MNKTETPARLRHTKRVFDAIVKLCDARALHPNLSQEFWPSTREIAESCGFSIYKTRYLLLRLVTQGWVQVTPKSVRNSLRWYTCGQSDAKIHRGIQ